MTDHDASVKRRFFHMKGRTIGVFGRTVELPASRLARIAIGLLLIIGGCFSFLPILGVWMLPLGFMVLSIDIAIVRRWRRRTEVRWNRWRAARKAKAEMRRMADAGQSQLVRRQEDVEARKPVRRRPDSLR